VLQRSDVYIYTVISTQVYSSLLSTAYQVCWSGYSSNPIVSEKSNMGIYLAGQIFSFINCTNVSFLAADCDWSQWSLEIPEVLCLHRLVRLCWSEIALELMNKIVRIFFWKIWQHYSTAAPITIRKRFFTSLYVWDNLILLTQSFITARCYAERGYEISCRRPPVCPWRLDTVIT